MDLQKLLKKIEIELRGFSFIEKKRIEGKVTREEAEIRFMVSNENKFRKFYEFFKNKLYKNVKFEISRTEDDRWHIRIYCENGKPSEDERYVGEALSRLRKEIHNYQIRE